MIPAHSGHSALNVLSLSSANSMQFHYSAPNTHPFTHTRLMAFVRDYPGAPVPERQNQSGFYWSRRQWVAVASSGPYASLHLAQDREPCQHPTAQFFTGWMPFLLPNQQRQSTEGTPPSRQMQNVAISMSVCLSVCTHVCLHISKTHVQTSPNIPYPVHITLPVAMAQPSSDNNAIQYIT